MKTTFVLKFALEIELKKTVYLDNTVAKTNKVVTTVHLEGTNISECFIFHSFAQKRFATGSFIQLFGTSLDESLQKNT